jgi:carboxypeptidase family protein
MFPKHLACAFLVVAVTLAAPRLGAQQTSRVLPGLKDTTKSGKTFGTIDGLVSDTNLVPIQAAQVSILRTELKIGTGPNGRFRITNVVPGQYLVIVRRVGFRPTSAIIEVAPRDTVRLAYALERLPANLDTVVITAAKRQSARLMEFDQRRKLGFGDFMTQDEIEKRNSVYSTELFRKFMSINVSPSRTGAITEYFAISKREGGNPNVGSCPMQVILDNVPLPTPFNLDLLPTPRDLGGIEVYPGASTTPPRFAGYNSGCGLILVWTKDGY